MSLPSAVGRRENERILCNIDKIQNVQLLDCHSVSINCWFAVWSTLFQNLMLSFSSAALGKLGQQSCDWNYSANYHYCFQLCTQLMCPFTWPFKPQQQTVSHFHKHYMPEDIWAEFFFFFSIQDTLIFKMLLQEQLRYSYCKCTITDMFWSIMQQDQF